MGDPVDILKEVGLNLVTGGLYSVGKSIAQTIETGDPMHLLGQGFDLGLAAVGNQIAVDIGGPMAGMTYNIAGLGAGLAGGGVAGVASGGFGTAEAGTAPLAMAAADSVATGGIPLAAGTAAETSAADVAGASLTGPVSSTVAPAAESTAPGGLASLAGAGEGAGPGAATFGAPGTVSALESNSALGLPKVGSSVLAPETSGYVGEITGKAGTLDKLGAKGFWDSLSPGAQTAMITGGFVGGQTIAGGLQGMFAGASAEQKLELEKLINAQQQQQVQYKNKNAAYAPLVTFKPQPLASIPTV